MLHILNLRGLFLLYFIFKILKLLFIDHFQPIFTIQFSNKREKSRDKGCTKNISCFTGFNLKDPFKLINAATS